MVIQYTSVLLFFLFNKKECIAIPFVLKCTGHYFVATRHGVPGVIHGPGVSRMVYFRIAVKKINGPSGNRTRVLGFEAQEDILYPMDPSHLLYIKSY